MFAYPRSILKLKGDRAFGVAGPTQKLKFFVVITFSDYETLRTTGVILAVVMFVSGILIFTEKLCKQLSLSRTISSISESRNKIVCDFFA
uniref:FXYD domain-containing ion transport regulator n=1 Tax=Sinocyclocheilus grahami TaxID=75366 RepID=A0A672QTD7_SINGR